MCCVVQCIRHRNQAHVKNAGLHHPSCTVVMQRRKSASPVLSVLRYPGSKLFLDELMTEFYHVPYSKPPEVAVRYL